MTEHLGRFRTDTETVNKLALYCFERLQPDTGYTVSQVLSAVVGERDAAQAALAPLAAMWTPAMETMQDDQPVPYVSCKMPTVGDVKRAREMGGWVMECYCFKCGLEMESVMDTTLQPMGGTAFLTTGHYGSGVFDPMDGTVIEIAICDDCLGHKLGTTLVFQRPTKPEQGGE